MDGVVFFVVLAHSDEQYNNFLNASEFITVIPGDPGSDQPVLIKP